MAPCSSRSLVLIGLLLAAPVLAGCIGGSDEDTGDPVRKQRAEVSTNLGGIEGVVTDTAVQPVAGANVTLIETDQTVRTAADGSFAFSRVTPGTYTVRAAAGDHVSGQEQVVVAAGSVAVIDFILTRLVSDQPFVQAIEFAAFMECGAGAGHEVDNPGAPVWLRAITIAVCGVPNSVLEDLGLGGNATNDRFLQSIELEAPIDDLVWEAQWDAGGNALGERLWLVAEIDGFVNSGDPNATVFRDLSAESPFRALVPSGHFQNMTAHFAAQCEDGEDAYCGYNFRDAGWPLIIRTFTATDCVPAPASACAPIQVKVDHVFTGFYNAPAPEGYSVFQGGTP